MLARGVISWNYSVKLQRSSPTISIAFQKDHLTFADLSFSVSIYHISYNETPYVSMPCRCWVSIVRFIIPRFP